MVKEELGYIGFFVVTEYVQFHENRTRNPFSNFNHSVIG